MPTLSDVQENIDKCIEHVVKTGTDGTKIEAYLTGHMLALVCAAYENEFLEMTIRRIGDINDVFVRSFIQSSVKKSWRSLQLGEISRFLSNFDKSVKESFRKDTLNTPAAIAFSNIIANRNKAAHGDDFNYTLSELILCNLHL